MAIIITLTPGRSIAQISLDSTAVATAANEFALELYGRVRARPGNLFFSPFSVDTALAMVYAGARGDTAAAMGKTLHLPAIKLEEFNTVFSALIQKCQANQADQGYELHVANALWAKDGFPLLPAYLEMVRHQYLARLSNLNFDDRQTAARTINDWVSQQTNDKIKNLISPAVLDNATRLVLTNAIYFKGTWQAPFNAAQTADALWHSSSGDATASMMHNRMACRYMEDDSLAALELPYAGKALAMLILLPKQNDGLAELEKSLTPSRFSDIRGSLDVREVQVSLPKFTAESALDLKQPLSAMGMAVAFTDAADLSGIDGRRDLMISAAVHKAFVQVDEQGTQAAAATGIEVRPTVARQATIFNADHPFLYVIMDAQESTILFMGRLTKP